MLHSIFEATPDCATTAVEYAFFDNLPYLAQETRDYFAPNFHLYKVQFIDGVYRWVMVDELGLEAVANHDFHFVADTFDDVLDWFEKYALDRRADDEAEWFDELALMRRHL